MKQLHKYILGIIISVFAYPLVQILDLEVVSELALIWVLTGALIISIKYVEKEGVQSLGLTKITSKQVLKYTYLLE